MTYVRRTETMLDDVQRKISNMCTRALEAYETTDIETDSAEYAAAWEATQVAVYREAPQLRGHLPKSWMFETRTVNFRVRSRATEELTALTTISAPDHRQFKLPKHVDHYRVTVTAYDDELTGPLTDWAQSYSASKAKRQEVSGQYREVQRQVIGFLRTHASLNAAVKEMPEIEMYVPDTYLRKMNEATAPRAKKEDQPSAIVELGIDRNALAAVAIAHRVMS